MAEIILSKNSPNQKKEITPEQEKLIRENYLKLNDEALAKALKVSASKVYKWAREMKDLPERPRRMTKKNEHYDGKHFNWGTAKQLDFILNKI